MTNLRLFKPGDWLTLFAVVLAVSWLSADLWQRGVGNSVIVRSKGVVVSELSLQRNRAITIAGPLGETWERLDTWPLFTEPFRLAVGKDHPLASRASVKPEDLSKQRLLCRTYCGYLDAVNGFLGERGVSTDLTHKVVSETDLVSLLAANMGFAIAPESSARAEGVRLMVLEGLDLTRSVTAYAVAGRQRSAAANTLIKMLRAADWTELESGSKVAVVKDSAPKSARI